MQKIVNDLKYYQYKTIRMKWVTKANPAAHCW
jgi:hypothetical protein